MKFCSQNGAIFHLCHQDHTRQYSTKVNIYSILEESVVFLFIKIQDLSQTIFELKGKMKRPNLKRVRVSADAMLGALLGCKVKESVDFKANLKTVKKEEEKVRTATARFNY